MSFYLIKENNQTYLSCNFELYIQDLLLSNDYHRNQKLNAKATDWSKNVVKLIRENLSEKISNQTFKIKNKSQLTCKLCLRGGFLSQPVEKSFTENFFEDVTAEVWIDKVLSSLLKQEIERDDKFIHNKDLHFLKILIPVSVLDEIEIKKLAKQEVLHKKILASFGKKKLVKFLSPKKISPRTTNH